MASEITATADVDIDAPKEDVWRALIEPEQIKQYMFGTRVSTDWRKGSSITWQGEWEGKEYEDKGEIIEVQPERLLKYTHYSPMSGQPDLPENYHTVSINLASTSGGTKVTLTQDNNETEKAREDSEANWQTMLDALKKHVEVAA